MECHSAKVHASILKACEYFLGEVKTGGWGRHGTRLLGIHSLIPVEVFFARPLSPIDVGRQRHLSDQLQEFVGDPNDFALSLVKESADGQGGNDLLVRAATKIDLSPRLHFCGWPHHGRPALVVSERMEGQDFHCPPGPLFVPMKPGREDARVVGHEKIIRRHKVWEILKAGVLNLPALSSHDKQATLAPSLGRVLSDRLGSKMERVG
jgi:hypothetical protein